VAIAAIAMRLANELLVLAARCRPPEVCDCDVM
jgi:hypothetical protein